MQLFCPSCNKFTEFELLVEAEDKPLSDRDARAYCRSCEYFKDDGDLDLLVVAARLVEGYSTASVYTTNE